VPLIYIGKPAKLMDDGALSDIAPTLLHLMGMDIPEEMTGHNLVQYQT
jgi:2,3-bisphosphoglycerate-independent phosphoglycerate mutase